MSSYGYFDDRNREYVITRPDTPLPWLNYIGQDEFFGLCTQTGGGYSFWKDARLRRLTRYRYNDVPMDNDGRVLYVKHGNTIWNPGWKPLRTPLDAYECRHGLGYTRIKSRKGPIEVEILFFVPPNENLEIWNVTVRNHSNRAQNLTLFSFVEFCFFDALADMINFQRTFSIGEVEVENSAIYHKTEFRERRNHYTLFGCTRKIDGFDTSRDEFVGLHHGLHDPQAVLEGRCRNSFAHGWDPIGAHQINLQLKPRGEESFSFILAYVEQGDLPKFDAPSVLNKSRGRALLRRYDVQAEIDIAFSLLKARWDEWFSIFHAPKVPNKHVRQMVNVWNQYQVMATFNMSRSASLYEAGISRGMGYRDSNQDLLGFVHLDPSRSRQRILDLAATQHSDGSCYHQYQPLNKRGNADIGGGFNDDPLWLVLSTCAYIRETADASILDEPCGYADIPGSQETLRDHLEISIQYTLKHRGPHGLPLIGRADWNDCLNLNCFSTKPDESFQLTGDITNSVAESVMIAGLFLYAARDLANLYRWLKSSRDAARLDRHYNEMLETLETHGWDGEWYVRAFDTQSSPIGSKECAEGRIYIENQAWCVLGGAGRDNGRARQALESVHKHLYRRGLGAALLWPAYSKYDPALGEISSYPPGYKENGSVFCHSNAWIQIGWCLLGEGERALDYYLSLCPSAKTNHDVHRCEPYVYPQTIASFQSPCPGEAKNSWLTGTAAWSFVTVSQFILGIRPDYDGLRVDPCIPKRWNGFTVNRTFRGVNYVIEIKNPKRVCKGVKSLRVNGKKIKGNLVPLPSDGTTTVKVQATLGA